MPLTGGSGSYKLGRYEGIGGNQYAVVYTENVTFNIIQHIWTISISKSVC